MKAFIDNTSLHRIFTVINPKRASLTVSSTDVMALFHFAEHILFTDEMEVSGFELPQVQEISSMTIDLLNSRGYIVSDQNRPLLTVVDFSPEEYAKACESAAPNVIEDLLHLDIKTLKKCGTLTDESARPIGIKQTPTLKWLTKQSASINRSVLKEQALSQKALGSLDYIVCINDALYEQLRLLGSKIKGDRQNISRPVDIFMRTAINQALASQRRACYSPAPQRAKIIHESDQLFRYALAKRIEQSIFSIKGEYPSKLLNIIQRTETLPLPIFAIHFLRNSRVNNPIELLEAARKLRDEPDVKTIRKWLTKWEKNYSLQSIDKREKALNKLDQVSQDIQFDLQKVNFNLYSILRPDVTLTQTGDVKIKPDISGILGYAGFLLRPLLRRKIFLATIAKEFTFDRQIGGDLIKMIGQAIN